MILGIPLLVERFQIDWSELSANSRNKPWERSTNLWENVWEYQEKRSSVYCRLRHAFWRYISWFYQQLRIVKRKEKRERTLIKNQSLFIALICICVTELGFETRSDSMPLQKQSFSGRNNMVIRMEIPKIILERKNNIYLFRSLKE